MRPGLIVGVNVDQRCPDDGVCHHQCSVALRCWRVENAGPLSAANFPDNEWPEEIDATPRETTT
jgi:hypothetical protein